MKGIFVKSRAPKKSTVHLRIQSMINNKYKHGVDLIYNIPVDKTLEAIEILWEAEEKLKRLRDDDM